MSAYTEIFNGEVDEHITYKNEKFWIKNGVLLAYDGETDSPEIPEGVSVIARGVFAGSGIKGLVCPSTLRVIEADAFMATELSSVVFNYGLVSIEDRAFMKCPNLSEVYFPFGLKVIGSKAFSFTNIREVQLPEGMLYVSVDAFKATPFSERQRDAVKALYKRWF